MGRIRHWVNVAFGWISDVSGGMNSQFKAMRKSLPSPAFSIRYR
jgi:hypothetical protein